VLGRAAELTYYPSALRVKLLGAFDQLNNRLSTRALRYLLRESWALADNRYLFGKADRHLLRESWALADNRCFGRRMGDKFLPGVERDALIGRRFLIRDRRLLT